MKKETNYELDLIDRNELYNQIRLHLNRHSLGETVPWTTLTVGEIASIIANIPTVKVEPRHGKWIADEDSDIIFICSECNDISVFKKNYCRNCGAKMDGERIWQ